MKIQHGEFIGPRATFVYQKSNEHPNQLVPDPVAAVIVRKIFEMAAMGTGVTGIVRYLNERGFSTPIQYAKAHGLDGNFDNGNGSWNSKFKSTRAKLLILQSARQRLGSTQWSTMRSMCREKSARKNFAQYKTLQTK